ncbi:MULTISPECIES: hypothetical protein [Paenibacillus]|uniref:hypothetical protein n=1 Tax=Paenibacillus TaxID=44249 RepID=UPI0015C31F89|nr:hypothetical protein [Paenibacillus peoriae]
MIKKRKSMIPMYVMLLPGLLYLLINNYIPMTALFIAFRALISPKVFFKVIG